VIAHLGKEGGQLGYSKASAKERRGDKPSNGLGGTGELKGKWTIKCEKAELTQLREK